MASAFCHAFSSVAARTGRTDRLKRGVGRPWALDPIPLLNRDGTIRFWRGDSADPISEPIAVHDGRMGHVWSIVFSPDGTRVATASRDGTARIWDLATDKERSARCTMSGMHRQHDLPWLGKVSRIDFDILLRYLCATACVRDKPSEGNQVLELWIVLRVFDLFA